MSKTNLMTESSCRERESILEDPAHNVYVGLTDGRGRGLFIRRDAKAGETVLTERPLVAMQSLDNAHDVTVCRNCMGFVGDVISQLEILSGTPRHTCIERFETRHEGNRLKDPTVLSGLYGCLQGCGEVYCSPECRAEHFESGHRLLCVGPVPEEEACTHPLVAFRVHAMQTNEIFLLVGEVVARIVSSFKAAAAASTRDDRSSAITAAQSPFADFVQHPWWEVAVAREEDGGEETREPPLSDTLRSLCERSASLLRDALSPLPLGLEGVVSVERVGRIVGMFEQNNVGIRSPSPLPSMLTEILALGGESLDCIEELSSLLTKVLSSPDDDDLYNGSDEPTGTEERKLERDEVISCESSSVGCFDGCKLADCSMTVKKVKADSDGEPDHTRVLEEAVDNEDIFAPLDGTALYTLVCTMNHSCRPNCLVKYPGRLRRYGIGDVRADPLVVEVVLLGNVSAGEELTQSYISVDMDLHDRRSALDDYGFFCRCPRCLEEEDDVQR